MPNASLHNAGNQLTLANSAIKMVINKDAGSFSIGRPDEAPVIAMARMFADIETNGALQGIAALASARDITETELDDVHGSGKQVRIAGSTVAGIALTATFNIYHDRPFLLMRLSIANNSGAVIRLIDQRLMDAAERNGGAVKLGDKKNPPVLLRIGWHDWCYTGVRTIHDRRIPTLVKSQIGQMYYNPTTPESKKRGDHWSEGWGVFADRDTALVTGFASTADQFGQVHVVIGPGTSSLTLVAQADGIPLDPGETFDSEWGYVQLVRLPHRDPAGDFAEAVGRQMHARVPETPPPAKWAHWYHFFHGITEQLFIDNLEVIDRIRDIIPFKTVQLDDGYQSAWGDWYTCKPSFPNGLEYLSKRIREKNYTPGLWLAPFVANPKSRLATEHPDWFIMDGKGKPIKSGHHWDFAGYALDATNPAVTDWMRELTHTMVHKWGYTFLKTDFVYAGALPGVHHNPRLTRAQAFRRGMEALREGMGADAFLLGCGCPFGPSIGIIDANRIGPDTAPNWKPYVWNATWATPFIKKEVGLPGLKNNIRSTLNLSAIHARWWWNDPDCLMVRDFETNLNYDEIKSNVTLMGLSGGLIINSDDLTRLSPERQKLIAAMTPILSHDAQPIDIMQREMPELYSMPVKRSWQDWTLAAVFNWGDRVQTRTLDLASLGLDPAGHYHVFDYWSEQVKPHIGPVINLGAVPSHGCHLLRIMRQGDRPCVVGSTLHITQGAELQDITFGSREMILSINDLGRRVEGRLWLWIPTSAITVLCGSETIEAERIGDAYWDVPISIRGNATIRITW